MTNAALSHRTRPVKTLLKVNLSHQADYQHFGMQWAVGRAVGRAMFISR